MSAVEKDTRVSLAPVKRPEYDPNNLDPMNAEARRHDDTSEGIDWDEIIATTQDDELAGRYAFNSQDYATCEEADAALRQWIHSIFERVLREEAAVPASDAARR